MKSILITLCLLLCTSLLSAQGVRSEVIAPGVVKLSCGEAEQHTPYSLSGTEPLIENMKQLPQGKLPFALDDIRLSVTTRGCQIEVPLFKDEQLYGFGLQIGSFAQRGLKKKPITNDHPLNSLGYTHAPQTFYVSDKGYGILVNTLRYTTFLCGTNSKLKQDVPVKNNSEVALSEAELYKNEKSGDCVYIDVPNCRGVEVFIFSGTDLLNVVQRYNLFSGGGCLPPTWGLGFKYRTKTDFTQEKVLRMAKYLRDKQIPCDVIGLEPGWQTATYSCSYVWNTERFPNHKGLIDTLQGDNYRVNLWEHGYVHPSSPIWDSLKRYSGDFMVWRGLVPDFSLPRAREIFTDYHKELMDEGISGFKLDECDNSDVAVGTANWGFPDMSTFPSGMDGEQMHQTFGALYVKTINDMYVANNSRTYLDYRAGGMFMSSVPATLYSDIYGHRDYVQMLCNSAFGGLLWSPEVRRSDSDYDFFHRLQTVLLSPQATVDCWFMENAPWLQYEADKNNRNEFLPEAELFEQYVRKLINVRMQLVPYLYDAFAKYMMDGTPAFRPLVMDYPGDKRAAAIFDQYMMGSSILVAPLFEKTHTRKIYLPGGNWYDFNTNQKYEGGREYDIQVDFQQMPMFIKEGTILPLAKPLQYISSESVFEIEPVVYGKAEGSVSVFEDDGVSYDYNEGKYNIVTLWVESAKGKQNGRIKRVGDYANMKYKFGKWSFVL